MAVNVSTVRCSCLGVPLAYEVEGTGIRLRGADALFFGLAGGDVSLDMAVSTERDEEEDEFDDAFDSLRFSLFVLDIF